MKFGNSGINRKTRSPFLGGEFLEEEERKSEVKPSMSDVTEGEKIWTEREETQNQFSRCIRRAVWCSGQHRGLP